MTEREIIMWRDIYHISGLHGLLVSGCPSNMIGIIRNEDRASLGISREEDTAAQDAVDHPEKLKNALIIQLPHSHWRCATDYLLFTMKQYFINLRNGSAVVHLFCEAEYQFRQHFGKDVDFVDDMYFLVPPAHKQEAYELFCSLI